MGLLADRDLALLHHLEQRGLDLGRRAVDLVGEEEVAEHRAELGVEGAGVGAVDAGADEVARDEVRRELDAPEGGVERVGEGADRQRLRETRDALEEEVAAGEQRHEHPLEHLVLADDDAADLEQDRFGGEARVERVAGIDVGSGLEGGEWRGRARATGDVGHETSSAPVGSGGAGWQLVGRHTPGGRPVRADCRTPLRGS